MYKGWDVYISFTKWRISFDGVQHPNRFPGYFDAIEFIDKTLKKGETGIQNFVAHADNLKTMEMKKIFLTAMGHKQVEENIIISSIFYIHCGDFLLLAPFAYMESGKITKGGINLYNFIVQNKLANISEIFKKEITILDGKITKNNLTIYDCEKMPWEKILNKEICHILLSNRDKLTCPLDN